MDCLVDSHALLWYAAGDSSLSRQAREVIENSDDLCYVSSAALWEIAIKNSLGKLHLHPSYADLIPQVLQTNNFKVLPISVAHASNVAVLQFPESGHRDPFDRVMIAQSMVEEMPIISGDTRFDSYPVRRVW